MRICLLPKCVPLSVLRADLCSIEEGSQATDESCTLNKEISLPAERLLLASVKNTHLLATSFDVPRMRDFPYLIYADVAKGDYDYAMTTDHANQHWLVLTEEFVVTGVDIGFRINNWCNSYFLHGVILTILFVFLEILNLSKHPDSYRYISVNRHSSRP
ncbi:hypothetical protein F5879DRAFT_627663 [Lentinula edodes]|nr:hypothetical protein F5879DRAFT_627663 [Lentinula edodes]